MKIIYNNWIPFKGFTAMNVCGWLFVRNGIKITDRLLNHEEIHTAQMKEDGYIWFYLSYLFFWIRNLFFFGFNHDAYRNIPYEREAYEKEGDPDYLKKREPFAWKEYNKL